MLVETGVASETAEFELFEMPKVIRSGQAKTESNAASTRYALPLPVGCLLPATPPALVGRNPCLLRVVNAGLAVAAEWLRDSKVVMSVRFVG